MKSKPELADIVTSPPPPPFSSDGWRRGWCCWSVPPLAGRAPKDVQVLCYQPTRAVANPKGVTPFGKYRHPILLRGLLLRLSPFVLKITGPN